MTPSTRHFIPRSGRAHSMIVFAEASAAIQSGSQAPQKEACDASVERTPLDGGMSGVEA